MAEPQRSRDLGPHTLRWGLPSPFPPRAIWLGSGTLPPPPQLPRPWHLLPAPQFFKRVKAREFWHTGFQTLAAVPAPSVCLPLPWDGDLAGEVLSQRRSLTIWRPSPRPLSPGVGKICCQSTSPQRLKTQRTQKSGDYRPPCLGLGEGGKTGWGRGQRQLDWQAKVRLSWHSSSRVSGQ